jgi:hypothetical protein
MLQSNLLWGYLMSLIRRFILAIVLSALTFANPVFATPEQDALHDQIMAGDIAGVEATLTKAVARDATPGQEPQLQRDMFLMFVVTDPKIDEFTANWLNERPGSAYAMTARGWYLHAMGRANRGDDWISVTYSDGIDNMVAFDTEALALFTAATKAEPGLLTASDGLIRLTQSIAPEEIIPQELERIMTQRPNRGTLMRAMYKLAPQWGGSPGQVRLVCDRYAPMVTTVKDYTPEVCMVDAVYFGIFAPGKMRDAASLALQTLPNPVLDYARVLDALDRKGTAEHRLAVLEKAKSERQLTPEEAVAYDNAYFQVNHVAINNDILATYRQAVTQGLVTLRIAADRDPLSTPVVLDYIKQLQENQRENGVAFDRADARARLQRLLTAIPHSWRAWMELAWFSHDSEPGTMERVGGYLDNSIYYSNYGQEALQNAVSDLVAQTDNYAKRNAIADLPDLTPDEVAEVDRLGRCKVLALTRLALAACSSRGISGDQCLVNAYKFLLKPMFEDIEARGVCQAEGKAPLEDLLPGPVPADF